jgi:hypothetical protein
MVPPPPQIYITCVVHLIPVNTVSVSISSRSCSLIAAPNGPFGQWNRFLFNKPSPRIHAGEDNWSHNLPSVKFFQATASSDRQEKITAPERATKPSICTATHCLEYRCIRLCRWGPCQCQWGGANKTKPHARDCVIVACSEFKCGYLDELLRPSIGPLCTRSLVCGTNDPSKGPTARSDTVT